MRTVKALILAAMLVGTPAAAQQATMSEEGRKIVTAYMQKRGSEIEPILQKKQALQKQFDSYLTAETYDQAKLEATMAEMRVVEGQLFDAMGSTMLALLKELPDADRAAFMKSLTKTPPKAGQARASLGTLLGLDAIRTSDRSFWVLIVCSTLMMIPFSFYNVYANPFLDQIGVRDPAAVQTIGQVSEVGFLLLLPLFFRFVGIKGVLVIGMAAWAVRYTLFANGFTADGPILPMIYAGLALHGVGFDFVFVAATIWVGKHFAAEASSRTKSAGSTAARSRK